MDSKSYKILKLLYRKKNCTYSQIEKQTKHKEYQSPSKYISFLFSQKYVSYWCSQNLVEIGGIKEPETIGYSITLAGESYVEERRRNGRNFWVPYVITTLLAVASLLVAILSFRSAMVPA